MHCNSADRFGASERHNITNENTKSSLLSALAVIRRSSVIKISTGVKMGSCLELFENSVWFWSIENIESNFLVKIRFQFD